MFSLWVALVVSVVIIAAISAAMWAYYRMGVESTKREQSDHVAEINKQRADEASKPLASRSAILERMRRRSF